MIFIMMVNRILKNILIGDYMTKLQQFLQFLKGKPLLFRIIAIILFAVLCFLSIQGCAYKFHADGIDNITKEIVIKDFFNK